MIFDEQSRDDARARFAEARAAKLDAAAERFLANEAAPELPRITRRPVRLRFTAQGELFQGGRMKTINDAYIGQRVRSTLDGALGEIVDVNWALVRVKWEDGTYGLFDKKDGWTRLTPRDLKDIEG